MPSGPGRRPRDRAGRGLAPAPARRTPGRSGTARCAPRSCARPAARSRPDTTRRSRRPAGRAPGPSPRPSPRPRPSAPSGRAAGARRAAGCPRRPGRSPAPPGPAPRVPPLVSSSSATVVPSGRSTRSAECIASPCSVCSIAISEPSCERSPTPGRLAVPVDLRRAARPARATWIVVPSSSVERPTTAVAVPADGQPRRVRGLEPGGRRLVGVRPPPPPKGWRSQTPNSSPSVSSNHQIHSPSGDSTPSVVPFGRSVTWRCSPGRPVPGVQLVRPRRVRDEQRRGPARPPPSRAATPAAPGSASPSPACLSAAARWTRCSQSWPHTARPARTSDADGPQPVDNSVRSEYPRSGAIVSGRGADFFRHDHTPESTRDRRELLGRPPTARDWGRVRGHRSPRTSSTPCRRRGSASAARSGSSEFNREYPGDWHAPDRSALSPSRVRPSPGLRVTVGLEEMHALITSSPADEKGPHSHHHRLLARALRAPGGPGPSAA